MESMPAPQSAVMVGVDTHLDQHVAAVIDQAGRLLDTQAFPAATRGYVALVTWAEGFGPVVERIGGEGTGTYGAGLACFARADGLQVVEVNRLDRSTRCRRGKSDPIDAQAAARATLAGVAATIPKAREGQVEMIQVLRAARRGALKAQVAAAEQLHGCSTAPLKSFASCCSGSRPRPWSGSVRPCGPGPHQHHRGHQDRLCVLARRWQQLQAELTQLDAQLQELVAAVAPALVALPRAGVDTAGQPLVTAGDNPQRLRLEAAFAHLCGVAPIPASSGRTDRHRLNRGGDRRANHALWRIAWSACAATHRPGPCAAADQTRPVQARHPASHWGTIPVAARGSGRGFSVSVRGRPRRRAA